MANMGKRMVKENLIAQIGQGGGGTPIEAGTGIEITGTNTKTISIDETVALKTDIETYTAGVGIGIDGNNEVTANIKAGSGIVVDTDLTDDSLVVMVDDDLVQAKLTAGTGIDITTNTISVDSSTVAMKSDLDDYQYRETYTFTDNPFTTEGWLTKVPVLVTNTFDPATDAKFGNNPTIDLVTNDASHRIAYFKGYCVIRDTGNDVFTVYATTSFSITSSTSAADLNTNKIIRGGSTDWSFYDTFYRDTQTITDYDSNSVNIIRLGTRTTSVMNAGASGLTQGTYYVKLAGGTIAANKNYPNGFQVPTTQGNYLLRATVDSNGKLDKFEWVAEADYLNV